jgi:MoaA/NifB/PqqE/SkfB family radical SAM enzyme
MAHDTEYLLKKSETFCMFPWVHFMTTPKGDVFPCCVGVTETPMTTLTPSSTFETIINSDNFKKLRRDMLSETKNSTCTHCYNTEKYTEGSWRSFGNSNFGSNIDEVLLNTKEDGTVNNFKMKYYDIRFNNICNFKCRMCGPDYSTLWAQEENNRLKPYHQIPVYNLSKTTKLLSEFLSHVDDVEFVYFAGGEPLITEEHYIILEELIRKNKTHVKIRYNTNCSVLSYKDKNIFDLWKHFDHIDISASIDHIGERAEYIRTGTDWGTVETNLKKFNSTENVSLSINTVLSIYNYTTLPLLYEYFIDFGIINNKSSNSLICTTTPEYFASTVLPKILKERALPNILKLVEKMTTLNSGYLIEPAINFTHSSNDWEAQKENFLKETLMRDELRNDSFEKTFPELITMIDGSI